MKLLFKNNKISHYIGVKDVVRFESQEIEIRSDDFEDLGISILYHPIYRTLVFGLQRGWDCGYVTVHDGVVETHNMDYENIIQ
ncbi:hypothetical protein [Caldisericum sp.]|uniref:hypothetical protein n=1 Tax=Caldisericum sp. TaxID=2499687 RepID=UPI003D143254